MLKQCDSIELVLQEAKQQDQGKSHIMYKIPDIIDWDSTEFTLNLGADTYKMTDYALKQFLKKLKIPYPYFKACSPELRDKEIREAISDISKKVEYIFKIKDGTIYGIIPKQQLNTLTAPFIEKVANAINNDVKVSEFAMDLEGTRIRFISTDLSYVEKDQLIPSVDFQFSEVGARPLELTSGLFRVVCSNGMMLPTGNAHSFKMPMARFKEEPFSAALSTMKENFFEEAKPFAELFERFKELQIPKAVKGEEEQNPEFKAAWDLVVPSRAIQKEYGDVIMDEFNSHEDNLTVNGLLNAVTRSARDITTTTDKERLESVAGVFVSKVSSFIKDATSHGETFEFTIPNIARLSKRHK